MDYFWFFLLVFINVLAIWYTMNISEKIGFYNKKKWIIYSIILSFLVYLSGIGYLSLFSIKKFSWNYFYVLRFMIIPTIIFSFALCFVFLWVFKGKKIKKNNFPYVTKIAVLWGVIALISGCITPYLINKTRGEIENHIFDENVYGVLNIYGLSNSSKFQEIIVFTIINKLDYRLRDIHFYLDFYRDCRTHIIGWHGIPKEPFEYYQQDGKRIVEMEFEYLHEIPSYVCLNITVNWSDENVSDYIEPKVYHIDTSRGRLREENIFLLRDEEWDIEKIIKLK